MIVLEMLVGLFSIVIALSVLYGIGYVVSDEDDATGKIIIGLATLILFTCFITISYGVGYEVFYLFGIK